MTEFTADVRAGGDVVWTGAAYEGDGRAYGPITEMLGSYVLVADPAVLVGQLGAGAGLVARIAPVVRDVLPDVTDPAPVPPEVEQDRTVDAVVEFVASVVSSTPLVIVVDDAHWADAATVRLVRTLARRGWKALLLVAIRVRGIQVGSDHPLSALDREACVRRVPLVGPGPTSVASLITELTADAAPRKFVEALTVETNGNPFFVREVVRHLLDEDAPAGRWALTTDPAARHS